MPNIPIISPHVPESSGGSYAKMTPQLLSPTLQRPVRANPGLFDGVAAANQSIAHGVAGIGQEMNEAQMRDVQLQARVKHATDSAFITRSQTQLEAAQLDFQNWTKTNPDPNTWDAELNARMGETKKAINEGAKALSPMAQQRLGLVLNDWESGTRKRVQLQKTAHSIDIATAATTEFVQLATANNDLAAVELKVAEGVDSGLYNPKTAQSIVARARHTITENRANQLIEVDPFEAERQLAEKNASGEAFVHFPDMSDTTRKTLEFRAHRAAYQQRTNIKNEWAHMIAEAQEGRGPMPDKDGIMEEAKRIGISPKWVESAFKVPTKPNAEEYAAAYVAISNYDKANDPTGKELFEISSQIDLFKGDTQNRLQTLLTEKLKPAPAAKGNPVQKEILARMKRNFELGFDLPGREGKAPTKGSLWWKQTTGPAPMEFADEQARKDWQANAAKTDRDAANIVYSMQLEQLNNFFKENPKATYTEAEEFRQSLVAPYVVSAVQERLTNPPPAPRAPAVTPQTARVKAPNGTIGTIPIANLAKAKAAGYTVVP